jgi:hypothetical protein
MSLINKTKKITLPSNPRFLIVLLSSIVILNSCIPVPIRFSVGNRFTNKFDGKYTGLDTILNVDGYYNIDNKFKYLFYRDGTIVNGGIIDKSKFTSKDTLYYINGWGHYTIKMDTIKAQFIILPGVIWDCCTLAPVYVFDAWFKILNKDTIIEVYNCEIGESYQKNSIVKRTASFHPFIDRPDSNCWLKTKPWAWKDGIIIK